jgi:uncharacterized protein (TIRG00374 family)
VAVVLSGLVLYILLPALGHVLGSWPRLATLSPWWLLAMLGCEAASFVCAAALLREVLHHGRWPVVISAVLAGNAVTNVVPGGDAVGASVQFRMLESSGISTEEVGVGLAAAGILGLAGLLVLPAFALPAIFAGGVSADLVHAAILGLIGFGAVVAVGVTWFTTDRPLWWTGELLQRALNAIPRRARTTRLGDRLLAQRNTLRADLGRNWWRALLLTAGRIGLDYISLLAALRATGARPNPALVLLAYAATAVVALAPLTPGGLGIVEASLSGLLVLAHVPSSSAVVATLAYRIGSYWLPILGGGAAYLAFRRRRRTAPT